MAKLQLEGIHDKDGRFYLNRHGDVGYDIRQLVIPLEKSAARRHAPVEVHRSENRLEQLARDIHTRRAVEIRLAAEACVVDDELI